MRKITIFFMVASISFFSFSQTTIVSQEFESSSTDTWNFTANPEAYIESSETDIWSPIHTMLGIKDPHSGNLYWGMRDLRNSGSGGDFDHVLQFDTIDVSGKSNLLISFYYNVVNFGASDYLKVELFYDGISQGAEELPKSTDAWKLYSKAIPNGTSQIGLTFIARQNGSTEYAGLDSIMLQSGANTTPTLVIDSPSNNASIPVNSAGFDVEFSVNNFILSQDNGSGTSDNSGDGYITYKIDGGPEMDAFGDGPINITGLSAGNHILELNLVNNDGSKLNPEIKTSLTFSTFSVIQSLPFSESFDYPVGEALDAQDNWVNNDDSNDSVLITAENLSYPGLDASSGNSVSFDRSGADPYIEFEAISSGQVYFSFIFKVTNVVTLNDDTGGYFALLRNGHSFESRVWLKRADFNSFYIGMSTGASGSFTSETFAINTPIFVIMSYDLSTGRSNLWVNPDPTLPAPTTELSQMTTPAGSIDNFMIRQGFSAETPFMVLDELKIGKSWSDVTNIPLSVVDNIPNDDKPVVFQNPIQNGILQFLKTDKDIQMDIFNVLGHKTLSATQISEKIDISHLSEGVYLAQFYKNSKVVGFEKIIVQ